MFSHQFESDLSERESLKIRSNNTLKCRGCLKEESNMNSLFIKNEENTNLAKIIEESVGYVISEEEQFSEYLCNECTKIIVDFVKFKKDFQEATKYFKSLKTARNSSQNTKDLDVEEGSNKHEECLKTLQVENDQNVLFHKVEHDETKISDNGNFKDIFSEDQIENSRKKDDKIKNLKCGFCNETFKTKLQLQRHEKMIHGKNLKRKRKKPQESPKIPLSEFAVRKTRLSSKTFTQKSFERLDVAVVTSVSSENISNDTSAKEYCKICKNYFPEEEFIGHFESHKTNICNTCGHRFIRKSDLNDHMETHLDVCKYVCQHCGRAFKVRTALNKHVKYHTHPRSEICHICGQIFNCKGVLNTHIKLKHFPTRDFQCTQCGLKFPLKSTLDKHCRRHHTSNRKKMFSCSQCNMTYFDKSTLNRHISAKHSEEPVKAKCQYCGKTFTSKGNLYKHLRTSHKFDKVLVGRDGSITVQVGHDLIKTPPVTKEANLVLGQGMP